jgi:cysteine-rich repeat protein
VNALPVEQWRPSVAIELGGLLGLWNETGGSSAQHGGYGSPTDVRILVDGVQVARLDDYDLHDANASRVWVLYGSEFWNGPTYVGSRSFIVRIFGSLEAFSNCDEVAVLLGIDDISGGLDTADDYGTWGRDPDVGDPYDLVPGDGIDAVFTVATVPACGNGIVEAGWTQSMYVTEACDDGNLVAGDGCGASCEIEPCADGVDNDGDGQTDHPADPGCIDTLDLDEHDPTLPCDDGVDGDGDGLADYSADAELSDPGCKDPAWTTESPQCQDGKNNDGQAGIDFDGGASLDLDPVDGLIDVEFNPATPPVGGPDPQCSVAWRNKEKASACGLGFELALLLPLLARRRRAAG